MNKNILYDRLTAIAGAILAGRNKFFSKSVQSGSFADYIPDIEMETPSLEEGISHLTASTPEGELDAAFYVQQLKGKEYPTVIYHHGSAEKPFDFRWFAKNTFRSVFLDAEEPPEANIIALRAPFHGDSLRGYKDKMCYLSNFVAMLSVSVVLTQKLISALRRKDYGPVAVSGISLGGWVANLHRAYFNSADIYLPLLAGAALDELFITSYYRKLAGKPARENPDVIRKLLNFEDDYMKVEDDNVFPLMGRYDQFIQYPRQKLCYGGRSINVLEKGHITASLAAGALRGHILSGVRKPSELRQ